MPTDISDFEDYYTRQRRIRERELTQKQLVIPPKFDYVVYDEADLSDAKFDYTTLEQKVIALQAKEQLEEFSGFPLIPYKENFVELDKDADTSSPEAFADASSPEVFARISDISLQQAKAFSELAQKFKQVSGELSNALQPVVTEAIKKLQASRNWGGGAGGAGGVDVADRADFTPAMRRGEVTRGWLCRECRGPADFLYILIERVDYNYPNRLILSRDGFQQRPIASPPRIAATTQMFPVCILHDFNDDVDMLKTPISVQAKKFMFTPAPAKQKLEQIPEAGQRHIRLEDKE